VPSSSDIQDLLSLFYPNNLSRYPVYTNRTNERKNNMFEALIVHISKASLFGTSVSACNGGDDSGSP